jgi:tetratricopeptide (TPR) repeat protein
LISFSVLTATVQPAAQNPVQPRQLLGRYSSGDFENVFQELRRQLTDPVQLHEFLKRADEATRDVEPDVAAAFLLEAAIAGFDADPESSGTLLERGCAKLRSHKPNAFELRWHLAAVSWLQSPPPATQQAPLAMLGLWTGWIRDAELLRGNDFPKTQIALGSHLQHALERFPRDLDLSFAAVLLDEQRLYSHLYTRDIVLQSPERPISRGGSIHYSPPDLKRTIELLRSLVTEGTTEQRVRAMLHLGFFQIQAGAVDEALDLWARARTQTKDESVRYLAAVFSARALWKIPNRLDDAIELLREAVRLYPRGEIASRLLASLLYLGGDPKAAGEVVEQLLLNPGPNQSEDPWWTYLRGDHDNWRARIAALRDGLSR